MIFDPNLRIIQYKNSSLALIYNSFGMLASAKLLHFLILWLKENSCTCNIENKAFINVVKKFRGSQIELSSSAIFFVISIILHFYLQSSLHIFILGFGTIMLTLYFLCLEPNKIEISSILESNNINIGCGAAQQYFNGYLKLIISEEKENWRMRLRNYKGVHRVDIYSKLIILLPESCQSYRLLTDDKWKVTTKEGIPKIRMGNQLPPLIIDKSGIKRIFNNTVYVIDEKIWFVAEYVPPLTTFCKMSESSSGHIFDANTKREQYILFCQHLKKLVEQDIDCIDSCLLLQYDDKKEVPLSQIILEGIENDKLKIGRAAG